MILIFLFLILALEYCLHHKFQAYNIHCCCRQSIRIFPSVLFNIWSKNLQFFFNVFIFINYERFDFVCVFIHCFIDFSTLFELVCVCVCVCVHLSKLASWNSCSQTLTSKIILANLSSLLREQTLRHFLSKDMDFCSFENFSPFRLHKANLCLF